MINNLSADNRYTDPPRFLLDRVYLKVPWLKARMRFIGATGIAIYLLHDDTYKQSLMLDDKRFPCVKFLDNSTLDIHAVGSLGANGFFMARNLQKQLDITWAPCGRTPTDLAF